MTCSGSPLTCLPRHHWEWWRCICQALGRSKHAPKADAFPVQPHQCPSRCAVPELQAAWRDGHSFTRSPQLSSHTPWPFSSLGWDHFVKPSVLWDHQGLADRCGGAQQGHKFPSLQTLSQLSSSLSACINPCFSQFPIRLLDKPEIA